MSACPSELRCPLPSSSFGSCSCPVSACPYLASYPVYSVLCHRHHLAAVVVPSAMSACPYELSCLRCPLPSSSFGSCSVPSACPYELSCLRCPLPSSGSCSVLSACPYELSLLCHRHHLAAVVSRVSLPLRVMYCPVSACPYELSCLPLPSSSFGSCSVPCQPAPPSYPVYSVLCHHHHLAAVSRVSLPSVILFTLSSAIIIIWQL